jgi:hypothetical protein
MSPVSLFQPQSVANTPRYRKRATTASHEFCECLSDFAVAGLVPAIHILLTKPPQQGVHASDERGHDDIGDGT